MKSGNCEHRARHASETRCWQWCRLLRPSHNLFCDDIPLLLHIRLVLIQHGFGSLRGNVATNRAPSAVSKYGPAHVVLIVVPHELPSIAFGAPVRMHRLKNVRASLYLLRTCKVARHASQCLVDVMAVCASSRRVPFTT